MHRATTTTTTAPLSPPSGHARRPLAAGTASSTHFARCGTCATWLHVDEDELIASLDVAPTCWACAVRNPGDGPAPA